MSYRYRLKNMQRRLLALGIDPNATPPKHVAGLRQHRQQATGTPKRAADRRSQITANVMAVLGAHAGSASIGGGMIPLEAAAVMKALTGKVAA